MKNRLIALTLLLSLLFLGFSCGTLPVRSQTNPKLLHINVSSPIENGTYSNNTVRISFTYDTKDLPSKFIIQSVVLFCDLDEGPGYQAHVTHLGDYGAPIPLSYSSTLTVPDGNHSLYVAVAIWGNLEGYVNTYDISDYSEIINFTVVNSPGSPSPTPNPSASPSVAVPEFPIITVLPLFTSLRSVAVMFKLRSRKTTNLSK